MAKASDEMIVKPTAHGIAASATAAASKGPPPVHLWNPPFCGNIDMRIARDGTWWHEGTPIGRPGLVRLFSGILKREDDRYFLVTPVEKVGIRVDDAPFLAVDFTATGDADTQSLHFRTLTDDAMTAGPDHPIRVQRDDITGEPRPYVRVRSNLDALIDRKSFYRMIDLASHAMHEGQRWFGIWSDGRFFPIMLSAELP